MENIKTIFQNKKNEVRADDAHYKSEFEKYVHLTAKLIKRSYIQTFKLVEDWQLHTIKRRYDTCMEYTGNIPKHVLWWSMRKKDN